MTREVWLDVVATLGNRVAHWPFWQTHTFKDVRFRSFVVTIGHIPQMVKKLSYFKLELMPITTSFRNYYDFTTQTFPQKLPPNPLSLLSHLHWKNIYNHTVLSMIRFYDRKITPLSSLLPKIQVWKTNTSIILSGMQSCICLSFHIKTTLRELQT